MCDLGLPCGKLDCPFAPRNAVETRRRVESPYGLNVKKLDPRATISTMIQLALRTKVTEFSRKMDCFTEVEQSGGSARP
jgi:hypothetical protein